MIKVVQHTRLALARIELALDIPPHPPKFFFFKYYYICVLNLTILLDKITFCSP